MVSTGMVSQGIHLLRRSQVVTSLHVDTFGHVGRWMEALILGFARCNSLLRMLGWVCCRSKVAVWGM